MWGGWRYFHGGGTVGEQSALMGSARIYPSFVVLPAKSENKMAIVSKDARMQGKFNSKEVKSKWLKGGFLE